MSRPSKAPKTSKALTVAGARLAARGPRQLEKLGATLGVARKRAARAVARNPLGAVVGATVFGFALAQLRRIA